MRERPFDNSHGLNFFVPHDSAMLSLAKLRYAMNTHQGAACLTGLAGTGKTELLRIVMDELEQTGWACAYIPNPSGVKDGVLGMIGSLLGGDMDLSGATPAEILVRRLSALSSLDKPVCVIVDDVHTVSDIALLEDLRMLLNVEFKGRRALDLLLAGQDSLEPKMLAASDFESHLSLKIRIEALNADDTKKYILYRLKAAGCQSGIFTRHAADRIHDYSAGVPRNINRLCELSLTTAYGFGQKKIAPEVVDMAAADLGMEADVMVDAKEEDVLASLMAG
ncbi:MAG: AAA family ATPase [Planctomycetes bacterium]|nr:AAA family ATPase [Planctomycetota bacterium]